MQAERPIPQPDALSAPFWEACRRHELRIQRCLRCAWFSHFPGPTCRRCASRELEWAVVTGRGTVYSFVVVHHVVAAGFPKDRPYVAAWVELIEQPGLRLITNIVGCDWADVYVGQEVEVEFEDLTESVSLPLFRPVVSA